METLKTIENLNLRTSGNKIHQTDNRQLKTYIHEFLTELLETQDIEVFNVQNALVIELPNDELGGIAIELKAIVKNLDYDIINEVDDYQAHLQAQADKKAEKLRLKKLDQENKKFEASQKKVKD